MWLLGFKPHVCLVLFYRTALIWKPSLLVSATENYLPGELPTWITFDKKAIEALASFVTIPHGR